MNGEEYTFEKIEEKIKQLLEKKRQLEYALKYNEVRQGLQTVENISDGYTAIQELEKVNQELENLQMQLRNIPRVIRCPRIKGYIKGRYEYDFGQFTIKLYPPNNKWACPTDLQDGCKTEIVTDENNVPIKVKRYLRNSSTYGMLLCYEYEIELDVKPNPEEIKPNREVKEEIRPFSRSDMIEQKSYIDRMMEKVKCPRCGIVMERAYFMKSSNLLGQSICPNCTYTTNWNNLPSIQNQNKQEEQKQNKKGILGKIKEKIT